MGRQQAGACGWAARAFAVLFLAAASHGCLSPSADHLAPDVTRPHRSVVLLFVDGLGRGAFDDLLAAGRLPNIQRHFVRGGVGVERAVACLPAVTYPNSVSILTGQFPGNHGVLGNQWFDPQTQVFRDYNTVGTYTWVNSDFAAPTIYEVFADAYSVNIQCHTRRGVSETVNNYLETGLDWMIGNYTAVDTRVGREIGRVVYLANQRGEWPTVLMHYFPAVDEIGHLYGADSEEYANAVANVDTQIGRIIERVFAVGMGESTYFVLLSDHGHATRNSNATFDVAARLREGHGLRVWSPGRDWALCEPPLGYPEHYDAVVLEGAGGHAKVHLMRSPGAAARSAGSGASGVRTDALLIARTLVEHPAVARVCVRAGRGRVRVFSTAGEWTVERRGDGATREYRVLAGVGRVGVGDLNALDDASSANGVGRPPEDRHGRDNRDTGRLDDDWHKGQWHDAETWLSATVATRTPDFVPQVVEMFDSPRAGDLVAFAADGWGFGNPETSGHGSCLAADMVVPLYFAGADLPRGASIPVARLVDVMPTIVDLLGEGGRLETMRGLDGIRRAHQLRAAGPE